MEIEMNDRLEKIAKAFRKRPVIYLKEDMAAAIERTVRKLEWHVARLEARNRRLRKKLILERLK